MSIHVGKRKTPGDAKVENAAAPLNVIPNVQHQHNFLGVDLLNKLKQVFLDHPPEELWIPAQESMVQVYGKWYPTPRRQQHYSLGDRAFTYKFSGMTYPSRYGDQVPQVLRDVQQVLRLFLGVEFNYVVVNRYENGHHYIGAHSDDEKEMEPHSPIASLSLGATRKFRFHHKKDKTLTHTWKLQDNDLFVMQHPTNDEWKHSVPKELKVREPRVNFTFRMFHR